ncbi:MAG TPA: 2-oxo acid dehydrogenase subunit E2 [Anaerolineales bacterium]|nr:2-oxo acid dehydrogenase subunit E2 [Anaerolineales bacterium]
MPALEMAQESGVLVSWLKRDGEAVRKGEPLMEIETDKVTLEIEAPASGILGGLLARAGDTVPVGRTIAWILAPGEKVPAGLPPDLPSARAARGATKNNGAKPAPSGPGPKDLPVEASPLARKIAEQNGLDLSSVKPAGGRIEKADVLAYLDGRNSPREPATVGRSILAAAPQKVLASPKARRLASERGLDLGAISPSGPEGAVLAADVMSLPETVHSGGAEPVGTLWRLMAERMTASWTSVPHFFLVREVDATNLIEWRRRILALVEKRAGIRPTYTDLFIKLLGATLRDHPRLTAAWSEGGIQWKQEINVGIAAAIDEGLIVPVIRDADILSVAEIAVRRRDLIQRAQDRKLRPVDVSDGTFTLSNLGMYNVDAFTAIVNAPQAAILALGRIAERVVPVGGQPAVRPRLVMTLSCDHRVVDGARAAQFLDDLSNSVEDPWRLLS